MAAAVSFNREVVHVLSIIIIMYPLGFDLSLDNQREPLIEILITPQTHTPERQAGL